MNTSPRGRRTSAPCRVRWRRGRGRLRAGCEPGNGRSVRVAVGRCHRFGVPERVRAVGAPGQQDVHDRHPRRHRLAQPVLRLPVGLIRGLQRRLRPARRLVAKGLQPGARARVLVDALGRRPHLDLHDPPGRQVVRRPAADGGRRRVHLQPRDQRRGGQRAVLQLREEHQERRARPTRPPRSST